MLNPSPDSHPEARSTKEPGFSILRLSFFLLHRKHNTTVFTTILTFENRKAFTSTSNHHQFEPSTVLCVHFLQKSVSPPQTVLQISSEANNIESSLLTSNTSINKPLNYSSNTFQDVRLGTISIRLRPLQLQVLKLLSLR